MIECIFTLDYEIYGNGSGSLRQLVYEPAEKLNAIFRQYNSRFVVFVEVAELEIIECQRSDPAIDLVKNQIRRLREEGHEIGLHLHPWWYNAVQDYGNWILDHSEYNLCSLPRKRISTIVDRAITYLRAILGAKEFTPLSYRAGHLLFQPTHNVAKVLADRGVQIDSSVYKGGLWHQHTLDYRGALENGYYWRFSEAINVPDPLGIMLELPIHTEMVPIWTILTTKRIGLQAKGSPVVKTSKKIISRIRDYLRFSYPLKLDFCSMTINELIQAIDRVIQKDRCDPRSFRPIVAIGHTKDLVDYGTVEMFLSYLTRKGISIATFEDVYPRCKC